MKNITQTIYTIDELGDKAKARALDHFRSINVEDGYWYDFDGLTGFSIAEGKKYGLTTESDWDDLLTYDRMYFDLDLCAYLQFVNPRFRDLAQARKFLGIDPGLWERAQYAYYFDVTSSRDGDTVLKWNEDDGERDWTDEEQAQLDRASERFADKRDDCLKMLRDEYKYQTSDEAIADTLQINDYWFDESGDWIKG